MSKDPAALLFIDNWLVSTKEMKADERGWYLNLVLHQYDKGDLPNDIEELANLADVRFSEYESFKQKWEQVLKQKFQVNDKGRLENPKARDVIKKREDFKDKRSLSGKIGYVVKVAVNELDATEEQVDYIKDSINFDEVDIKDKQVLKQMLKQTIKLYINGNGNKDIIKDKAKFDYSFVEDEMKVPFMDWLEYKKAKGKTYKTQKSLQACYSEMKNISNNKSEIAIKIVEKSMANNWDGIFPLKPNEQPNDLMIGVGEYKTLSGDRTYGTSGVIVPNNAPPRPSSNHIWSKNEAKWKIQ